MKKFVLTHFQESSGVISNFFFECESEEMIPFNVGGYTTYFNSGFQMNNSQRMFLRKFGLNVEILDSIYFEELPVTFIKLEKE